MAKQKRKPVKAKPITSHPLFPAVVALWFGALFGLGSLAVRPSLLENLVLSSRLDLVVPAAAPPLGVTARIMVALILAAIGAMIGAVLARRLTRPKVEHKERTRSARGVTDVHAPNRARDAHPDAPACKPISMRDLGEDAATGAATNVQSSRRRGLTADHAEEQFVPHDFAPLPGGAVPVLDLGLQSPPLPVPEVPVAAVEPARVQMPVPAAFGAAPAPDAGRQVFHAEPAQPAVEISPDSAAAHADGRQVFGMQPVTAIEEKPRQIFGVTAEGDHVPQEFIRDAGYRTTVFETETPQPLFERGPAVAEAFAPPLAAVQPFSAAEPVVAATAPVPQAFAPAAAEPIAAPVAQFEPEQPPLPSPASLGMTDLASRLAESMRRRRAAKGEAAPAEPVAPEFAVTPPVSAPEALPQFVQPEVAAAPESAPVPQAFEPAPIAAQPVPQAFEPAPIAVQPAAFAAEPAAPEPAPFAAAPTFAAPASMPLAVPTPYQPPVEQPAFAAAPSEPVAAQQAAPLPSALRPLALDAFLEDDSTLDLGLLPPRHIAMPAVPEAASPAPQPVAFEAARVEEPAEEAIPEENYASLLGISQPRGGFVRIEVPEPDSAAPEPVVIFPGQAAFGQPAPVAATAQADDGGTFRRFDGPDAAGHGQPLAADTPTAAVDSSAADQALRSALANLQRMSGAA